MKKFIETGKVGDYNITITGTIKDSGEGELYVIWDPLPSPGTVFPEGWRKEYTQLRDSVITSMTRELGIDNAQVLIVE